MKKRKKKRKIITKEKTNYKACPTQEQVKSKNPTRKDPLKGSLLKTVILKHTLLNHNNSIIHVEFFAQKVHNKLAQ